MPSRPPRSTPTRSRLHQAAAALVFGILLVTAPKMVPAVLAAQPRVVVVVGPVGALTDRYRAIGDAAAAAARELTDDVVTVYSPHATWPAVRAALRGASVVIYLGHGNGWPSPYASTARPRSQNGLGLNAVDGVDDVTHQYFGEAYLSKHVQLAPSAVVLLSHLCYASGNSEPGLPEGALDVAKQRVDNFAAGWIAAGAGAVIADAFQDPAYYVRRILSGRGTVEGTWRSAPSFHDHVVAFPSVRTPGLTALMDPTRTDGGYYRSLVTRAALRADEVARGAGERSTRAAARSGVAMPEPRPLPAVDSLDLVGQLVVGGDLKLVVAFASPARAPAAAIRVGIRWDPIRLDPPRVATAGATPSPAPSPAASPGSAGATAPKTLASAQPAPDAAPDAARRDAPGNPDPEPGGPDPEPDSPSIPALVAPEVRGSLVVLAEVEPAGLGLSAAVEAPQAPGLYRLVMTLHDADGVALDAEVQDRIPALVVKVAGPYSAALAVPPAVRGPAGSRLEIPIAIANTGTVAWAEPRPTAPASRAAAADPGLAPTAGLVGRWMPLVGWATTTGAVAGRVEVSPSPGGAQVVVLVVTAPDQSGDYLLFLDVVSPLHGSMAAAGSDPVVVRVVVEPATDNQGDTSDRPTHGRSGAGRGGEG